MDYEKLKDELQALLQIVTTPYGRLQETVLKSITRIAVITCELAIEEVDRRKVCTSTKK